MTQQIGPQIDASFATNDVIPSAMQFGAGRPARENAAHLEQFFAQRANSSKGFLGADGVYSITVGGRTVFAFGDTFIGGRVLGCQLPGNRVIFPRNSFGVAQGGSFQVMAPSLGARLRNHRDWLTPPDAVVPLIGSKDWYWPGSMYVDAGGLHVFLNRYHQNTHDAMWGWSHLGTSMATIDPKTLSLRSITPVNDDGSTIWGAASLPAHDHLYMYGGARDSAGTMRLTTARTKGSDTASGWEYLSADGDWSADPHAAQLGATAAGSQFSVVANARGGVDLITQDGFAPRLTITHGETPAGPWDDAHAAHIDLPPDTNPTYIYNAVVHESLSDADRLVVSVNQNTFSIPQLLTHPELYRPHFFTIPRPGTAAAVTEHSATWGE